MVNFGQELHTWLQILDDQGQPYQIIVDGGPRVDVITHNADVLRVTIEGRPISEIIFVNLLLIRSIEVIEL